MAAVLEAPILEKSTSTKPAVIDCDIHNVLPSQQTLSKYLPDRWRRHHETVGPRGYLGNAYPRAVPGAARHDSWPPSGLPAGSDLGFMQEQLLDAWNIEIGVLNCLAGAGGQVNREYGAVMSAAINDWQIEEWLDKEPRLRASIVIPYEDGGLAAAEIDRAAQHPGFVQVLLVVRTQEPLGRRKYHKIYEAAERNGLPVGIHFGGGSGPITGTGIPSHYYEDHCGMAQAFQPQVTSFVYEGVFELFPRLKVVLIEGGFAWMPPLMWRLDRLWEHMGEEIPLVKRPPSAYIREHMWLTTQPMEEPGERHQFDQLLAQMDMDEHLLFATDYPHWDFDAPDRAFPVRLSTERERQFLADNARKLYRF